MSSEDPTQRIRTLEETTAGETATAGPVAEGQTATLKPSDFEDSPTLVTTGRSADGTAGLSNGIGADLALDTTVANRYRVRGVLGVGGMGIVYRVDDQVLGIPLALKILRPEIANDTEFLQRFRNELVLARQVTHRNVVRIHDIGEHQGMYFLTMDLVEGRSLQSLIRSEGKLSLEQAADVVRQIASALGEAHRQDVVHRDLKPANILLDPKGNAYVTDFGVARSLASPGLTRTGEVLGTPDYLSPEQARGERVDGRSDLYTLGLMFVEMLSGKLPFPGGTVFEILAQRISGNMRSLDELGVEVPEPYTEVIDRCVAKDPAERYQTAEELIAGLDAVSNPNYQTDRQKRQQERRRRHWTIGLAGGFVLLALLVAGLIGFGDRGAATDDATSSQNASQQGAAAAEAAPPELAPVPPLGEVSGAVAILPFDADDAWASYGLAEALSANLVHGESLRIVAGSRVAQGLHNLGLSGKRLRDDQLRRVMALFEVDHLVLGTLQGSSDGWTADAEVVRLFENDLTRRQVTAATATVGSLEALQSSLSQDIFTQLDVAASANDSALLPSSPQALRAYGEGLEYLAQGEASLAIERFQAGTQAETEFAPLWVQLADTYQSLGFQAEALDAAKEGVRWESENQRYGLEARAREALLQGHPENASEHLQRLITLHPHLVEARIRQAEALGQLGQLEQAVAHLDQAVALDPANPHAWYFRGRYTIGLGDVRRAVDEDLVRSLTLFKNLRDLSGQALVLNALGVGHQRLGEIDEAVRHYTEAADIRRRSGDRPGLASTLHNLAWVHLAVGDFAAAEGRIQEALGLHEELENPHGMAELHNAYGLLEESRGRFADALDQYRRALQIRDDLGLESALAESYNNVGYSYFTLGEYDNAKLYLEKALALHRKNDAARGIVLVEQNLGFCQLAQGEWDAATKTFEEALTLSLEMGEKTGIAVSQGNLARLAFAQGYSQRAFGLYAEALDILEELGNPTGQVDFTLDLAEMHLELADTAASQQALDRVSAWLAGGGSQIHQARYYALMGSLSRQLDDPDAAQSHFLAAAEQSQASDSPIARLEVALGQALLQSDLQALEATWQEGERLGHVLLRLRLTEALAQSEVQAGSLSQTEDRLRAAVRLAEDLGYRRTYRLLDLLAEVQEKTGKADAAQRSKRRADEELNRLRPQHTEVQWLAIADERL